MRVWMGAINGTILGAVAGGILAYCLVSLLKGPTANASVFASLVGLLAGGTLGLIVGGGLAAQKTEEPWRRWLQFEDESPPAAVPEPPDAHPPERPRTLSEKDRP